MKAIRGLATNLKLLSIVVMLAGAVMFISGVATWFTVQTQLAEEKVTVAKTAPWFVGEKVDGPLTAYAQAEAIKTDTDKISGGKTFAEMERNDPKRTTVQTGSFLRASLFTSVISFGVSALVTGLGALFFFIGYILTLLSRQLASISTATTDKAESELATASA